MRKSRLNVEQLEDRCVPVTWGNPWPDAAHLTLSLAPDGTAFGSQSSALFKTLDAAMTRDAWQKAVLRAFQTWAINANINIGLAPDGGQALGTPGAVQADPRFGDVRVAGLPLTSDALALSMPFDPLAGTLAGDVRVNTSANFNPATKGYYDLYTVLLQEAGHVFGLGNSTDPASVMYETYSGPRSGLSAGDVSNLQALYGPRTPDANEGKTGNDTLSTATRLNLLANSDGSLGFTVGGDITTSTDKDVYAFTTPLTLGSMQINLGTAGLSLLTAKVSVYDSAGNLLKTTAAVDPRSGDLTLSVSGLKVLSTYYVKVEGNGSDVFRMGGYLLQVRYLPLVNNLVGTVTGVVGSLVDTVSQVLVNNDLHTNDSYNAVGVGLQQSLAKTASPLDYAFRGSISDKSDIDFYKVVAPSGSNSTLAVMAWGTPSRLQPGSFLSPVVRVFDASGRAVKAEVLVNNGYSFTVQVQNATAGATYYVSVGALDPNGSHATGNYFLGVDFRPQATALDALLSGQLSATQPAAATPLTTDMSGMYHFVLAADAGGAANVGVLLTVFDSAGNQVYSLGGQARLPVSGDVYLPLGTYHVRVMAGTFNGGPLPSLTFSLKGMRFSDNNGPQPVDPTSSPSGSSSPSSTSGSTTTYSSSSSSGVGSSDAYSDPYASSSQQDWFNYWGSNSGGTPTSTSTSPSSSPSQPQSTSTTNYSGYYYT